MKAVEGLTMSFCLCLGLTSTATWAQQPDSLRTVRSDSLAIQQFVTETGPAEGVITFIGSPAYRFKTGIYTIANPAFPLRFSPDSLVYMPLERSYRQKHVAYIARIATLVPLLVFTYAAVRVAAAPIAVLTGHSIPGNTTTATLLPVSGTALIAGLVVTLTFDVASAVNLLTAIKRHNRRLGRRIPTLFNPKGL